MNVTGYSTLNFDTNSSKGTVLVLLFCLLTVGSSTMSNTRTWYECVKALILQLSGTLYFVASLSFWRYLVYVI